jgi:hypothetical protein
LFFTWFLSSVVSHPAILGAPALAGLIDIKGAFDGRPWQGLQTISRCRVQIRRRPLQSVGDKAVPTMAECANPFQLESP